MRTRMNKHLAKNGTKAFCMIYLLNGSIVKLKHRHVSTERLLSYLRWLVCFPCVGSEWYGPIVLKAELINGLFSRSEKKRRRDPLLQHWFLKHHCNISFISGWFSRCSFPSSPWLCAGVSGPWLFPASSSCTYSPFSPTETSSGPRPCARGGGSVSSTRRCGPSSNCGSAAVVTAAAAPAPRRPRGWSFSCGSSVLSCGSCGWSSHRWKVTSAPWTTTRRPPGWTSFPVPIATRSSQSDGETPWPPTWTRCCVCSPASATTGNFKLAPKRLL